MLNYSFVEPLRKFTLILPMASGVMTLRYESLREFIGMNENVSEQS